jgi:hypothetical protein
MKHAKFIILEEHIFWLLVWINFTKEVLHNTEQLELFLF